MLSYRDTDDWGRGANSPQPAPKKQTFRTVRLSAKADTMIFSLAYDATTLGMAQATDHPRILECAQAIADSRKQLVEYIAMLEKKCGIERTQLYRFD